MAMTCITRLRLQAGLGRAYHTAGYRDALDAYLAHLQGCQACREYLADLDRIAKAQSLPSDFDTQLEGWARERNVV